MSGNRLYRVEGLVLKTSFLGDRDVLVTLIASDGSKLTAMAWGARKLTSRKMGHIEQLNQIDVTLYRGRNMPSISQVQSMDNFQILKGNLERLSQSLYITELVDGFAMEANSNPELYTLFLDCLHALQDSNANHMIVPFFQFNLLSVCGHMPELYRCVECGHVLDSYSNRFCIELGGLLCDNCKPELWRVRFVNDDTIDILRLFNSSPNFPRSSTTSEDIYRELRSILDKSIRYWLDKDVQSSDFMDHVGRYSREQVV
ncbi:DNA repair protein RecO [SAR202 cluster bacterium AC-409-J13_OGT_754m]|nr:DNA repair protein RecO [SAR202 cluster bacterium AC-409-J13_OGT_754m]